MAIANVSLGDPDARAKLNAAIARANEVEAARGGLGSLSARFTAQDAAIAAKAPISHVHGMDSVTGLQDVLDLKATASSLTSETAIRAGADASLQSNIDSEKNTRAAADVALQKVIDAETQSRIAADAALPQWGEGIADPFRPGEAPRLFTSSLTGLLSSTVALPASAAVFGAGGRVLQLGDDGYATPRMPYRVEPTRLYKVRAVVWREINSPDPASDAVQLGLQWLDRVGTDKGTTTVRNIINLTVGSGRKEIAATVAAYPGEGIDHVAPSGTVYVRPFVQVWGDTQRTHVEIIEFRDVTDVKVTSPNIAAATARVAALESIDAGNRLDVVEAALDAPATARFTTRSAALAASIGATVDMVETLGYADDSDHGGALYKRAASEPAHAGKFQSDDGAWWELSQNPALPTSIGAKVDGTGNASPAVQAASEVASGVHFSSGLYRMVPGSTSSFTLGNTTSNVYRAVAITEDDVTFDGVGAVLHGVSRASAVTDDVQPVFSTDKNMTIGTVKNLSFKGMMWESENDADVTNSNQRFAYLVGVDGLRFIDSIAKSSGIRRGYFAHIQNSRNIQFNGYRQDNVTGGLNFRYVENLVITNFIYRIFSEAIDLDGTQSRAVIRNGIFESTSRLNQCIDVNSQIDASIGDFSVYNVGNIVTINYKTTTPPTYADYVGNVSPSVLPVSKRIIVSNITGSAIGSASQPCFHIGWDWAAGSHVNYGPVQDITIENIDLADVGYFLVREARNLRLNNISLRESLSASTFAAVHMSSQVATADELAWSDLDVQIRGLRIENANRGGLRIAAASRALIDGLITKGNNTAGGTDGDLILTGLATRACRAVLDNCDIEGSVVINGDSTAISAWASSTAYKINALRTNDGGKFYRVKTAGTSASSGGPTGTGLAITDGTVVWEYLDRPYSLMWGRNNRIRGTVTLQGDVNKYVYGESVAAALGDLATTGTVNKPIFVAKRRMLVNRVSYAVAADAAAHASNYRSLILRRYRAGVSGNIATINTNVTGFTAFVSRDGNVPVSDAEGYLEPGDVLVLNSASAGTGVALSGLSVTVDYIEY